MRTIKSERLKKLESELTDLEQWLKLGLVPKKDEVKHKEEIRLIKERINDEKERLQFLRESGDIDDIPAPKKGASRSSYTEMPTIPDIDVSESVAGFDNETQSSETQAENTATDDDKDAEEVTKAEPDEESYFSDRNRWKRGGIIDPDADEW